MAQIKGLDSEERLIAGNLIRQLREANGSTQSDVAAYFDIKGGTSVLSRIERGLAPVSARRVLGILTALAATPEDHQQIMSLAGAIPALNSEVVLDQLIAAHGDELEKHGALTWLARMTGLSPGQVRERLSK